MTLPPMPMRAQFPVTGFTGLPGSTVCTLATGVPDWACMLTVTGRTALGLSCESGLFPVFGFILPNESGEAVQSPMGFLSPAPRSL